jgi:hypothetical protein
MHSSCQQRRLHCLAPCTARTRPAPTLQVLMHPRDAQGQEITWRNVAALDGYVRRLNEVADRLADKNRWAGGPSPQPSCCRRLWLAVPTGGAQMLVQGGRSARLPKIMLRPGSEMRHCT